MFIKICRHTQILVAYFSVTSYRLQFGVFVLYLLLYLLRTVSRILIKTYPIP
jgi:hypothetical protein